MALFISLHFFLEFYCSNCEIYKNNLKPWHHLFEIGLRYKNMFNPKQLFFSEKACVSKSMTPILCYTLFSKLKLKKYFRGRFLKLGLLQAKYNQIHPKNSDFYAHQRGIWLAARIYVMYRTKPKRNNQPHFIELY